MADNWRVPGKKEAAKLKENAFKIPSSVKELGIKSRNYTEAETEKFIVKPHLIHSYGKTSLMIKNIPNKYT